MTPRWIAAALAVFMSVMPAASQELSALARLDVQASELRDAQGGVNVSLALSRTVPWRLGLRDGPPRLIVDFRTVEFGGLELDSLGRSARVTGLRAGEFAGWSRLVLDLAGPLAVEQAGMTSEDGGARVDIMLRPVAEEAFAALVTESAETRADDVAVATAPIRGEGRLRIMLDPGHGGVDPGAVREGVHEADITLAFARALRDELRRRGRADVFLTRTDDVFVSLEGRITAARHAGADVFLSLHADAVPEGIARGAQVWTLSEEASSRAGAQLAERHNRADLLAGLDLTGQEDTVARVLMDIARTETEPRTDALADALVTGLVEGDIRMHSRPRESAAFAVLKAPDIPSALIELGFMSSPGELEKLTDPEWRAEAAAAIADGLLGWAEADAALSVLRRR